LQSEIIFLIHSIISALPLSIKEKERGGGGRDHLLIPYASLTPIQTHSNKQNLPNKHDKLGQVSILSMISLVCPENRVPGSEAVTKRYQDTVGKSPY